MGIQYSDLLLVQFFNTILWVFLQIYVEKPSKYFGVRSGMVTLDAAGTEPAAFSKAITLAVN